MQNNAFFFAEQQSLFLISSSTIVFLVTGKTRCYSRDATWHLTFANKGVGPMPGATAVTAAAVQHPAVNRRFTNETDTVDYCRAWWHNGAEWMQLCTWRFSFHRAVHNVQPLKSISVFRVSLLFGPRRPRAAYTRDSNSKYFVLRHFSS